MADFASRLRVLRTGRALRQRDLADSLGIAQTSVANHERKVRFPDEPTLLRIADYFGVCLDYLMGRGESGAGGPVKPEETRPLEDLIRTVRNERALESTRILVGGQAFSSSPGLWRDIGADATAPDAERAMLEAGRVVDRARA